MSSGAESSVFREHQRRFEENRFVYPVVSRRSRGVSVGINLNPDKVCNFDCIYCQVNRQSASDVQFVEREQLLAELTDVLHLVLSGRLFQHPRFSATPAQLRRLNDIAFSGDGEPTTFRNFDEIVADCAAIRRQLAPPDVRMVLITNASMLHRTHVQRALDLLDQNNGQIWAKLDAGTEDYFRLIDRTSIPFQRILQNITQAAQVRSLVIQSLWMAVHGEPPSAAEIQAWCDRLNEMVAAGGRLELLQIYTVARAPAEGFVTALSAEQLQEIAAQAEQQTGLPTAVFG